MKRLSVVFIAAFFVIALAAGSAWATGASVFATHDADDGARSYKIATEGYDEEDGLTGAQVVDAVYFVTETGTLNPISMDYRLTNGQFFSATNGSYYLAVWSDDTDGVIENGELNVVTGSNAVALAGGAAAGAINFDPGDGNGLHTDINNDGTVEDILVGTDLVIVQDDTADPTATPPTAAEVGVNFGVSADLSPGANIGAEVIENDGTAAEQSATTTLAQIFDQYVGGVGVLLNAVVDVAADPSRTEFVGGTNDILRVDLADRNAVDTTVAPFNDSAAHNSGNEFLVMQGAGGGSVDDVFFDVFGSDQAIDTVNDGADLDYNTDAPLGWRSENFTDVTQGGTTQAQFTFTVTGDTPIDTRDFTCDVVSDPLADFLEITYLSGANAGSWTLNGYQAICPYNHADANFGILAVISNRSDVSGGVFWDVLSTDDVANVDPGDFTNIQISGKETIDGGETVLFSRADLNPDSLGLPDTVTRFSLRVTVNAPQNEVHMIGIQQDGDQGKRSSYFFNQTNWQN